jgi:type I restriction enzyme S subunit
MSDNWPKVPVSQVATIVLGGTPSRRLSSFWNGKIPWATARDVASVSGRYLEKVQEYITEEGLQHSAAKLLPKGTILMTARGTVGSLAMTGHDMAFNQTCYALVPKEAIDKDFLYYVLKGTLKEMEALTYGTIFSTITIQTFNNWLIPLPNIEEQKAIAHILGTLDDKIELNHRMNETLEQMARAIFKSWFVDFDPVRAKMSGRWKKGDSLPGLPAHLWDLFPDRLVPSELGDIPEGWPVVSLSEIVEINPPRYLKSGQIAPYLDMANMPTTGHMPNNIILRPYSSGMRFINGDTLLARITPCLENGKTAFVNFLRSGEIGWGSTEYIVLRPKAPFPEQFAYFLARSSAFRDFAIQSMSGTSGRQRVSPEALSGFKLVRPSALIALEFGNLTSRLLDRAKACSDESQVIASLRASLLPKLIGGEICINSGIF